MNVEQAAEYARGQGWYVGDGMATVPLESLASLLERDTAIRAIIDAATAERDYRGACARILELVGVDWDMTIARDAGYVLTRAEDEAPLRAAMRAEVLSEASAVVAGVTTLGLRDAVTFRDLALDALRDLAASQPVEPRNG